MNKIFWQIGFLINMKVQNSGKGCPDRILWQEKKVFTVLISIEIHLDLHKGGREQGMG